jgi:hypothetical protein
VAQDAKAVIGSAQKALGDLKSISYSGSARDVAFQQCGANATAMVCQGYARSDAANQQLRSRHRSDGARVASHWCDEQHRAWGISDRRARHVLSAGHTATGGPLAAVGRLTRALHHAWPISTQVPSYPAAVGVDRKDVDCRVIVIDDNRDAASVTAMLVEELGGECKTAFDGESGLREMLNTGPMSRWSTSARPVWMDMRPAGASANSSETMWWWWRSQVLDRSRTKKGLSSEGPNEAEAG